ncbi:hypothetical protein [Pelagibaculum spongiae]|uniref:Uncharacterized protein n=1 Tax=Pelagibaculum spongiae TaxID=2080658 RepID=A0A2V1H163_9GAMM|nr:hypothetical protein [Pelagibaculum spongiae]PVZ69039.1 hypothetical protein DC094_12465 [Pelagibaculum spongiae]
MEKLKEILKEIDSGKYSYESESDSLKSLQEFQNTAKRIISAKKRGYISSEVHQIDYQNPEQMVRHVLVQGGLTLEGSEFLHSTEAMPEEPFKEDIIDIKPNFAGIKTDAKTDASQSFLNFNPK